MNKKKEEFNIPIGEICHIATDIGYRDGGK